MSQTPSQEAGSEAPLDDAPEATALESEESAELVHGAQLLERGRGGANWFFWIAGLSLVNTAVTHFGGDSHFVIGLGVTLFVDVIAREVAATQPDLQTILTAGAIAFSVLCSIVACLFGWLARKRFVILFGLGMFVYFLDGLLFLLIQDWFSLGFHGFALFSMWGGLAAYRELNRMGSPEALEVAAAEAAT